MAEIDPDTMELAVRRISDQVTVAVRASLFKLYAVIGTAVVAAVGFSAWDIYRQDVKQAAQETKAEVLSQTSEITKEASKAIGDVNVQIEVAKSLEKRQTDRLDELDKLVNDAQPKLLLIAQTEGRLDQMAQKVADVTAELERDKATVDNFPQLSQQVIDIGKHLDEIDKVLAELRSSALSAGHPIAESAPAPAQNVVAATQAIQQRVISAAQKPLVFLQYDSLSADQAEAIRAAITADGFLAPAKERLAMSALGEFSVRYCYVADAAAAAKLAESAQHALAGVGFTDVKFAVRDLTNWPNKKPNPNTLELWIAPPAKPSAG